MVPPKEIIEIVNLNELGPISSRINHRRFQIDDRINVIDLERQKRITVYHYVVHILAFLLIIPYITLIIYNVQIPDSFSTIVSVVIGFYFARSLFR